MDNPYRIMFKTECIEAIQLDDDSIKYDCNNQVGAIRDLLLRIQYLERVKQERDQLKALYSRLYNICDNMISSIDNGDGVSDFQLMDIESEIRSNKSPGACLASIQAQVIEKWEIYRQSMNYTDQTVEHFMSLRQQTKGDKS